MESTFLRSLCLLISIFLIIPHITVSGAIAPACLCDKKIITPGHLTLLEGRIALALTKKNYNDKENTLTVVYSLQESKENQLQPPMHNITLEIESLAPTETIAVWHITNINKDTPDRGKMGHIVVDPNDLGNKLVRFFLQTALGIFFAYKLRGDACSICLESFGTENKDAGKTLISARYYLKCMHAICQKCFVIFREKAKKSLENIKCPLCRTVLESNNGYFYAQECSLFYDEAENKEPLRLTDFSAIFGNVINNNQP